MTHPQLVRFAAKWLRVARSCGIVLCETGCGGETPDAIGWKHGGRISILIECKASRADFLADQNKNCRQPDWQFAMGDERYYLAPAGMIDPAELRANWGLLEISGGMVKCRHAAQRYQHSQSRKTVEMELLYSELRLHQIAASGRELFPTNRAARIQGPKFSRATK